ncbi:hypothetical protein B0J11DRAFT_516048 [Dendryphion nanum]|uniref:Uncharacterized protein n=1 Tax=Dendryphion nanum TaxID=256645 RepID=A0A9P9EIY9_9PLEO|nr:hypothetical protein B0J11DRAFT_516048 [Dendryphion nanum]
MIVLALFLKETPLLTTGDAIVSFLTRPSLATTGMCLTSRSELEVWKAQGRKMMRLPKRYRAKYCLNFRTVSVSKWLIVFLPYTAAIIIPVIILQEYLVSITANKLTMYDLGLGKVNSMTTKSLGVFTGTSGLILSTIIINAPQLILSCLYFVYNTIFTAIFCFSEWQSYGRQRKGLRVSTECRGSQRTTYFLGLPYKHSIPLAILSSLLHWALSQTLFLVDIDRQSYHFDVRQWRSIDATFGVGFSPLGVVVFIVLVSVTIISLLLAAISRFETVVPRVSNCSFAIAAACHLPRNQDGVETSESKVQWGVTEQPEHGVGHCSFSMLEVTLPEEGKYYM